MNEGQTVPSPGVPPKLKLRTRLFWLGSWRKDRVLEHHQACMLHQGAGRALVSNGRPMGSFKADAPSTRDCCSRRVG
jgi:hypothetical protein